MACKLADSSFLFMGPQQRPIQCHRFAPLKSPSICFLKWENLPPTRIKHQRRLIPIRRTTIVQAVAVPVVPSPADSLPYPAESAEYRKQLCESYGFKQIGEPLPENVTLKDIIATLPKKVFEIDDVKAWKSVLISVTSYVLGLFMISKAPWFLLPLAWAWTGTAITGFFVIGHDCAHKSFSKNKLVEDIVGTLAFLPLIYPYEPWRFKHDQHHAKTNMLFEDTAWHPVWREEFDSSPVLQKAIIYGYGPFRPLMSIAHWLMWHFDTKKFRPNEVKRVKISLACVFAFLTIGWPLIVYKAGIMGWIKFWLMPWLGYHFWALELGLGGVVLKIEDVKAVFELKDYFDRRNEANNLLDLTKATVTQVKMAGMGDRVCVDLCSLMKPGEGLLVGSFARGLFLVHSECLESNYISSRPFWVNAVVPYLLKFLNNLTNIFVRFNRKRLKGRTEEEDCRIALSTLYHVLIVGQDVDSGRGNDILFGPKNIDLDLIFFSM